MPRKRGEVTIAEKVRGVLPEAIKLCSDNGTMKFGIRSLWYKVIEFYHKLYPNDKFYEYNSFTQDFLRTYEKQRGKIPGLVRGPRGKYCGTDTYGNRHEDDVKPDVYISRGIANKVIIIEKLELWVVMKENDFDKRLDCILMSTSGFTTEAGRDALIQAQGWGLPICPLHDYDINGVLIQETLARPTRRLDTEIDSSNFVDVGLNFDVVQSLIESKGLEIEPTDLSEQDINKLNGMLERGEITSEEHDFLKEGRVELNALTPREMLVWLEERLEELDLWKTVPDQDELDKAMEEQMKSDLDDARDELVSSFRDSMEKGLGLEALYSALLTIRDAIEGSLKVSVEEHMEDFDYPTKTVEEFVEELRKHMEKYWIVLAQEIASKLCEDLADPFKSEVEDEKDDMVATASKDSEVTQAIDRFTEATNKWLTGRNHKQTN